MDGHNTKADAESTPGGPASRDFSKAAVNSITDPGVVLNVGNAFLTADSNIAASLTNLTTATMCFAVRGASELKKIGVDLPLPKAMNKLVENPGAALTTAGVVTLGSAGVAATSINPADMSTAIPAVVMTCFGVSNTIRGMASGLENGTIRQRIMEAGGILAAVLGFTLSNPEAPVIVQTAYVTAGAMAGYLALRKQEANGILQPDMTFAAGNFMNAGASSSPEVAVANTLWGAGYLSLSALKNKGGVVEAAKSLTNKALSLFRGNQEPPDNPKDRTPPQPPPSDLQPGL